MGTYATSSDLVPRIGGRPLTSTSKPSTTQVDDWITEAESQLTAALTAAGIGVPAALTDGGNHLKVWTIDFAEGHFRMSHAAAGGDGDNDDGQKLLDKFEERIQDIRTDSSWYDALLNGGASSATSQVARGSTDRDAEFTWDEAF